MSTDLVTASVTTEIKPEFYQQGEFEYWTTTPTGINFLPSTPEELWCSFTENLCRMIGRTEETLASMYFRIGDALRFGEAQFGENHSQAIELTKGWLKLSESRISNIVGVCRAIPLENRHFVVSQSHYEAVQSLDPTAQAEVLQKAVDEGASVATVKTFVVRKKLTDDDRKAVATVTSTDIEELTGPEIKKALKRAKKLASGEPEKETAVIDLNSDEGILHGLTAAQKRLESLDFGEAKVSVLKLWSRAVANLAKAFAPARREQFALEMAQIVSEYLTLDEMKGWDAERHERWQESLKALGRAEHRNRDAMAKATA